MSVLIGGLVATSGAMVTQWWVHRMATKQARRSLANALAGEIDALCSIAVRRRYLEGAQQLRQHIQKGGTPATLRIQAQQDYFLIYKNNVGSIGLLPPALAGSVARFYTQTQSFLEDVMPVIEEDDATVNALDHLDEQIKLLEDTLALGQQLAQQLPEVA